MKLSTAAIIPTIIRYAAVYVHTRHGKNSITFTFATARADRQPLTFPIAICFSFALQHNGLEKLNNGSCERKVVETAGRKYKLTAV